MLKPTIVRVEILEENFKKLTKFIGDSFNDMGDVIEEGNKSMEAKIDELFENIGKNNDDLGKIKADKKTRDKIIRWGFGTLKQALATIVSILIIYSFLKYGGKIL